MASDLTKLDFAKLYLRRKKTLSEIKTLSDTAAAALLGGTSKIVITSSGFEGGQATGSVEMEAVLVGLACEQLIRELDPQAPAPSRISLGDVVQFG